MKKAKFEYNVLYYEYGSYSQFYFVLIVIMNQKIETLKDIRMRISMGFDNNRMNINRMLLLFAFWNGIIVQRLCIYV